VMGMFAGWTETYFSALAAKDVVLSGNFCLTKRIR